MRLRSVLLPLAATVASALVPGVAFAKVTKNPKTATHVVPCNDGTKKVARVWWNAWNDTEAHPQQSAWKSWAVANPCKTWLIIDAPGDSVSDPYGAALSVHPKTSFQTHEYWSSPDSDEALGIYTSRGPAGCGVGYTLDEIGPKDHGHWRLTEQCPSADDIPGWYGE